MVLHVDTAKYRDTPHRRRPRRRTSCVAGQSVFTAQSLRRSRGVSGDRFFGRTDELRELDRLISQGNRHIGLFGLRRIGKTSLLLELRDRLRLRPEVAPVFLDLELSAPAASAAHVAFRCVRCGGSNSRAAKPQAHPPWCLARPQHPRRLGKCDTPGSSSLDLGVSLVSVLAHGALQDTRLVVILDEAEVLEWRPLTRPCPTPSPYCE